MTLRESKNTVKALDKLLSKQELALKKNYEASLKNIKMQIATLYEKTDGNFVDAVKFNRLASLEDQIGKEIQALSGKNAKVISGSVTQTYEAAKLRELFTIEKELGMAVDFTLMNKKAVAEAVKNPYDRIGIVKRTKRNGDLLADQIRQEVTQGLIQGKSFANTARALKNRLEIDAGKARTIVRTETHRARGIAKQDSQEEAIDLGVIMKKMWVASIDDSTREAHADLDGVTIDVDEDFESDTGGSGPGPGQMNTAEDDINCRCTVISVIEGYEPTVRRVRDEGIVKFDTFENWEETRTIPERR